jgi:hypothetical protein
MAARPPPRGEELMRSLFVLFLFAILVLGGGLFFKGHASSVNLYYICGKEVPWYNAVFLEPIADQSGCAKYK